MSKYLDETGLNYLWGKVKSYVSGLGFYTKPSTGIPATDIASGVIPTVPTALSAFTDDLGSNPTHTHSQYLTSAPVTSVNGQTGAVNLTIPSAVTESTVTGWGFTKNAGNVSSVSVDTIVYLTESEYESLGTKDSSTLYIIPSS